jgi:hypothetical protein
MNETQVKGLAVVVVLFIGWLILREIIKWTGDDKWKP